MRNVRLIATGAVLFHLFLSSCSSGPSGPRVDLSEKVIVAFGNSITAGVGDTNYPSGSSGYPFRLEQMLLSTFPSVIILNRGVPGERTSSGVRRLNTILARENPDFVLILEGINNIQDGGTGMVSGIVADLESMVRAVKASGATPLIASILPTTGPHNFQNTAINTVNPLIASIAVAEEITFVDLNGAFRSQSDYTLLLNEDGLHPNSNGYNLIAEVWFNGLLGRM